MKKKLTFAFLIIFLIVSCNLTTTNPSDDTNKRIEVIINDIPFKTESYLRIPYSLKIWQYEKEGLKLEQIQILNKITNEELMIIDKNDFPEIYKPTIEQNEYFKQDEISSYYISIQIPISLDKKAPSKVFHKFVFRDTLKNSILVIEGGEFSPRLNENPIVISSPVKGKNWVFSNQSSMAYHFYVLFFRDKKVYRGERFAFDNIKVDDSFTKYYDGNPLLNESYFNYGDTLYAVANGKIITVRDGRPENNGNAMDVKINSMDEIPGNYFVLDIGKSNFAVYAHCIPNSILVKEGQIVKEGQALALLGNSGNSTGPHLHFHITDSPDILFSNGQPFVIKNYIKIGDLETGAITPKKIYNSMMEQYSVINFE